MPGCGRAFGVYLGINLVFAGLCRIKIDEVSKIGGLKENRFGVLLYLQNFSKDLIFLLLVWVKCFIFVGRFCEIKKNMSRGKITVGAKSAEQKEIDILDFVQSVFKDNRVITVAGLEDGSMLISVENPESTGRASHATIWLSEESVLGVLSTCLLYFGCKGEDIESLFLNSLRNKDMVDFTYSDNLKGTSEL